MTANTRLKVGLAFALGGNLLFFTSAWIAWMPWSASFKASLWGVLFFAPETGTLICVALIGRETFEAIKKAMLDQWREWRGQPGPDEVPPASPEAVRLEPPDGPFHSPSDSRPPDIR